MKKLIVQVIAIVATIGTMSSCSQSTTSQNTNVLPESITLTKEVLMDKVKGGWAGQTIGVVYGGPTEFVFRSAMIPDHYPIKAKYRDGKAKWYLERESTLFDDIYMDLTFVEVYERLGMDAPIDSFAKAFAYAGYDLWHANEAARYNILNGIMPPESGYWKNNPHADDIDYQIEADFAGLMTPGMPNTQSDISDKIGHIMNYGDGWYGGVYVGAMYSLAYVSDNINFVVTEALKTIPTESRFHKCISDVIRWHEEYPEDWKRAWFECEKKWNHDIGCPEGALAPYNIDAVINAAYIVIGLLYGEEDLFKTMDISTRCGQDSDCNPASAVGILCTMKGYNWIEEEWIKNIKEIEDMPFPYTNSSLNKTYEMSFNHALQMIERNGGKITDNDVTIKCQVPVPVRLEQGFPNLYPYERMRVRKDLTKGGEVELDGTGIVFGGWVISNEKPHEWKYVAEVEMYMDGQLVETAKLPTGRKRRVDLFWKYEIPKGKHVFTFKHLNPRPDVQIYFNDVIKYTDTPYTEVQY